MNKEQSHKTIFATVVKRSTGVIALMFIGYLFMFFFRIIAARALNPEGYGNFELLTTLFGMTTILATIGLTSSVARFLP